MADVEWEFLLFQYVWRLFIIGWLCTATNAVTIIEHKQLLQKLIASIWIDLKRFSHQKNINGSYVS